MDYEVLNNPNEFINSSDMSISVNANMGSRVYNTIGEVLKLIEIQMINREF